MKTNSIEELMSELRTIGTEMRTWEERGKSPDISEPTSRLKLAAMQVEMAWSGSNRGYHSCVYYEGFAVPPPGVHFSSEWGLGWSSGSGSGWFEYAHDDVVQHIYHLAGDSDLSGVRTASKEASRAFEEARVSVTSIISAFLAQHPDEFLTSLKDAVEKLVILTQSQATRMQMLTGPIMTRDTLIINQGFQSTPHQEILGELVAIGSVFRACSELGKFATLSASHIERLIMAKSAIRPQGQSIFIGHGRSLLWRELKDFIKDRLHLPWEEFNRVPVAGRTNIIRLSEMLDASGIAFLILTAEDERADKAMVARQNVVHEAGLFQGRLGFERAIILLEEGCEPFSNIEGLGQIRFPHGNIKAAFEEVRGVLEREGFLDA